MLQMYLVFFSTGWILHSNAIETAFWRATKLRPSFSYIASLHWENSFFLDMRRKSRYSARNSRFSQSKINFYVIKISYSESAQKTELNKIFFKSISQLSFFIFFRAYIWIVVVRLHSKKWKLSNSFERYFVQRSFFCWFRIWCFYFIEVNFWLRKSRTTSRIPTFSPHI